MRGDKAAGKVQEHRASLTITDRERIESWLI
jgi:hypothetical protein